MMSRRFPDRAAENDALGQLTEPCTEILVVEFQVWAAVLTHGPTAWAPPVLGKVVWQESREPTPGVVERCPSPRGTAVGSVGTPGVATAGPTKLPSVAPSTAPTAMPRIAWVR